MFMNDPLFDIVNSVGAPIAGAKATFYLTGTDTLTDTYTTEALTTPNTNPVIADSAGRFPPIYLDPTVSYRLKLFDANDVLLVDRDPIAQANYFARTTGANTFTAAQTFGAQVNFRDATFYANYASGDSTLPHINFDANDYLVYDRTGNFFKFVVNASERFQIGASTIRFPSLGTTASAANAFLDSGSSNELLRSTSSRRYKTDIEPLNAAYAERILELEPVWYRSTSKHDKAEWSWYGLIAEDVAAIEPRLVHWMKEGDALIPDGVQYDRLAVLLLAVVKQMKAEILALKAGQVIAEASFSDTPIPESLAPFAAPDETIPETKTRLLKELADLRSMAVGNLPMTEEQRAMLTTLEGAVAQKWFAS